MAVFDVNLMRDRVTPPGRRKLFYVGMTAFVLVCVASGMGLAYATTRLVLASRDTAGELTSLRKAFQATYPRLGDPARRADGLTRELGNAAAALEAVEIALQRRIDVPQITAALAGALPAEARLMNLKIDGKARMLSLEILIVRDPEETGLTTAALIDAWQAGDVLSSRLGEIHAVSTRTQRMQGERAWVWQFEAKILLGG